MLGSISRGRESPEKEREGRSFAESQRFHPKADACQTPFVFHSSPSPSICLEDHFLQCPLGVEEDVRT